MLSFQELQEKKKTNVKINPKKEEMMEKSDVIDSGTSTEELYDSQEEVVEKSSEESETKTTLLTFEERAARKMTLRNLQTLKKKTIPAGEKAESKRKKEGKGEYSAAYKKKETDVTNYDDKAPAKKAAPKKKSVTAVKKVTPKAAPKKSEPKAKAKPAPKKAAPKPVAKKEAPKKETPKSKSVGDKARDWVKKGIKRHRKATQGARVFGKGFAKGVKTAVKVAKDVKKVVSEGKTYSQFMKEMNNFNHSANQPGAWSIKGGFKFGKGTGQNKHISLNVGTGDNTSTIASYQKTSTVGTGKYKGNEVSNALNRLNQIQHGGDGGWSKEDIAKEVAKERRYGKTGIASTGGPNSKSSKIRQEEVELKTMNELFGLFKGRGQSGGNTGGGTIQKGGYNHAKSNPKSGNNPVLGFARNLLGNKQNKAPAATFFQSQQKKQKMIDQILGNSYEPEGEMVEGIGDAVKKGVKRHKDAVEKKKIKNRKAVPYAALAAEHNPEGKSLAELATGILKNKPGSLASEVMSGLQAAKKVPNTAKLKVKSSEVAKNVKEKSEASVNEVTKVTCDKRKKVPAYKTTDLLAGSLKREEVEVVDEAKVDKGRSDYGKASIRNYRRSGPGHGEPAMFDSENKRGKTIDKRREEHKARRGKKGAKVPAYKVEETQVDEATRLKKEKGYDKGGTKKPSGKPTAMSVVLDKIRKEHGHGAVVGQGGSRQDKKKKGAKSDAGTGKYLKRAKEKAAYKVKAKKAGFKSTQDYTNTMARYGGEDNYKKGKGLGT